VSQNVEVMSGLCVKRVGNKAERKFEMRLGLVFGEPEKKAASRLRSHQIFPMFPR
jgi:hypothetical protein